MLHIPGLLASDELSRTRSLLERAPWIDGRETAGTQSASVKRNRQVESGSEPARALQAIVLGAVERHALFFSAALPKRVLPPMFNRYGGTANTYGNHVDQAIRRHPQTGQGIRSDLSCTVFLNDPAEYDGGELVIEGGVGATRAKFAAGDAVLYPGGSVHRVEPVTRGERFASFFWVESIVRSDEQRRLLFDMDMALLRLRQAHGESAEAVALTGTYHNLLRLWAET
ncbi:MAG TPA: Fe2+-dependent dioxygenase [Rubrivivax sp.]